MSLGLKRKREVKDIVAVIPFAVVLGNLDGRVESKMLDKAFVPDLVAEPELELSGGTEAFRLVQADESERLEGLEAEADASLHPQRAFLGRQPLSHLNPVSITGR